MAYLAGAAAADEANADAIERPLAGALLSIFLYWQFVPVLMVTSGVSLDLSRIIIYPVSAADLFAIQAALRVSTAVEPLLVTAGLGTGLLFNSRLPWLSPVALVPFVVLNTLLSAGLRDLFSRLMARRRVRETVVFVFVLLAAAPQALLITGVDERWQRHLDPALVWFWPWGAAAQIGSGRNHLRVWLILWAWSAVAFVFAADQFRRSIGSDPESRGSRSLARSSRFANVIVRVADRALQDPLAALVTRELRSLSRAPRFRLLFLMGFSFGLLIWMPLAAGAGSGSLVRTNFLTVATAYSLMLLGDILFWNIFGADGSAAQSWFAAPVELSSVIRAKNVAAAVLVTAEISLVSVACWLLGMPITLRQEGEAFGATAVLACFMISAGNLISCYLPRRVNLSQSWRTSTGRTQAILLLLYPLVAIPAGLAWGARYAFNSDLAFWAVILADLIVGAIVYSVALETAAKTAWTRREAILQALSHDDSPMAG